MLANKENVLIHGPLHGAGKINPKTPGPAGLNPKTPFKVMLNDDKLKTGKNDLFAGRDPSMFITPAGPRRAALTGKTTNAKARLAPRSGGGEGQKSLQKTGRPLRTRLSVTTEIQPILNEDGEAPEIEYMPPREIELSDFPDDFQAPDYEKLSKHVYTDCHRHFLYDIDESGKTKVERQLEESERQIIALLDAETDQLLSECKPKKIARKVTPAAQKPTTITTKLGHKRSTTLTDKPVLPRKRTGDTARPASAMSNTSINSRPSTAASIRAATALSQRPASSASTNRPGISTLQRPTTKMHSRSASTSATKKSTSVHGGSEPTRPSSRTTARPTSRPNSRMAAANSKTTIGYTTGKEVAKTVKKALALSKVETALEVCERILREDEERQNQVPALAIGDAEEEVDNLLKTLPSMDEDLEEEFFITVPNHE